LLTNINAILDDPLNMLILFLLAFPGRILALSAHEWAHAWVADRCGDHTARMMGRLTLNPFRHLDPLGTAMMLLVGFGWAKPVPVNPRNFRNYRKDDLKVSLAGVTMNLILFFVGTAGMVAIAYVILKSEPGFGAAVGSLASERDFYSLTLSLAFYRFGDIGGYLTEMLYFFIVTNLVLCVFNLLPVPPLDGYHVLNDLVLKRNLFADPRTARIASGVLFALVLTGVLGKALGWVDQQVLGGVGNAAFGLLRALGAMG